MPEERLDEYLEAVDRWQADRTREYPMDFSEWNAVNAKMGRPRGDFTQYLDYCKNSTPLFTYDALIYFNAIDDDDFIGDES